jgi:phospholipid/cholesterol/gamma-HCH transport system permease protein
MMPVLAVFSNLVAIIGAFVLTAVKFGFSSETFFDSIQRFFQFSEIGMGIVKSAVFGAVTALIGCYVGYQTTGGAEGVGQATVRSFTFSAALILLLDAMFGSIM